MLFLHEVRNRETQLGRNITTNIKQTGFNTNFPLVTGFCREIILPIQKLSMLRHSLGGNDRRIFYIVAGSHFLCESLRR